MLFRSVQLCELMLLYGADITTRDIYGSTPLHSAASKGDMPICEMLLANGAKESIDNEGRTPLFRAASEGYAQDRKSVV